MYQTASQIIGDLIWQRDKGICGICDRPVTRGNMDIDHAIPRSMGGEDRTENLRAAHVTCNRSKKHLKPGQLANVGICLGCNCSRYAEHSTSCLFRLDCPACGRGFSVLSDLVDHIDASYTRILEGCVCILPDGQY